MSTPHVLRLGWPLLVVAVIVALGVATPLGLEAAGGARNVAIGSVYPADVWQEDLVSDVPGAAMFLDESIVNPMGIEMAPLGLVIVANNGSGVLTVHEPSGMPVLSPHVPLVVTVPAAPSVGGIGSPTGVVRNHLAGFDISNGLETGRSLMLVATLDGLVAGWNPYVMKKQAIVGVDRSAFGAAYYGLDVAMSATGPVLAAADFRKGKLDLFDANFNFIRSFTDPDLKEGYAPFNVRMIDGQFIVTFALQAWTPELRVARGQGLGFVSVFEPDGTFVRRLVSGGPLNAPWAVVKAPTEMHDLAGMLLVGNVGNGRINAFNLTTGSFYRALRSESSKPVALPGLFGLTFHKDFVHGGDTSLYFTAGMDKGAHGLIGRFEPVE